MHNIVEVLGAFGDERPHYKEEVYEVIRLSNNKKWSVRFIDDTVKKYLAYGLITAEPDTLFRGHYKWKITDKGIKALDFYRNQHHKDPSKGVLF